MTTKEGSNPDPGTIDLDDVLVNELGQFGKFQMLNIALVSIPIIMSAFMSEYIFSAAAIPHRSRSAKVIRQSSNPIGCLSPSLTRTASQTLPALRGPAAGRRVGVCAPQYFDTAADPVGCDEYVNGRENSVVYDFDLQCQEWLRTLAGTLNSVGTLLVLPIIGFVSDRWGRRVALVVSVFNLGLIGFIRAFSVNYPMYLVLQILQTTLGAGTFSSAYIFAAELVGPKFRVLTSATMSSMFAVGQVILGFVAWGIQPWRHFVMVLHAPCLLIIAYYWILSESVRWLLSKGRYEDARVILEKVARVNRKTISEKTMQALLSPPASSTEKKSKEDEGPGLVRQIIRSKVMLRRVCTTPIWWVTTTFVYYGLSINSVGLSDQMYVNFIATCAVEIPGFYTAVLVLNRIGRKATLSCGYFLSAACCITFAFLPDGLETLSLVLFLLGKFGISVVFTSLYLFTSELYPTQHRHKLLAFSSMIGRVGSITAPLTPALAMYWDGIPSLMFGVMGLISGLLVLTQPETLGTKMPDTLAEAEALGRSPPPTPHSYDEESCIDLVVLSATASRARAAAQQMPNHFDSLNNRRPLETLAVRATRRRRATVSSGPGGAGAFSAAGGHGRRRGMQIAHSLYPVGCDAAPAICIGMEERRRLDGRTRLPTAAFVTESQNGAVPQQIQMRVKREYRRGAGRAGTGRGAVQQSEEKVRAAGTAAVTLHGVTRPTRPPAHLST
ncbi:Organic cation transporter protein [Eumeta japonica]|uniref:Organic cation transporter protein n=1 Tax=Eumeta variegata TaxID=151549 RepID=A0A4C1X9T4_EUMVA|nr:Organic cation transporter protein [Eumeta japonica]